MGRYDNETLLQVVLADQRKKKGGSLLDNEEVLQRLEKMKDFHEIYTTPELKPKRLHNLSKMREAFEFVKEILEIRGSVASKIQTYLKEKGNPEEYDIEDLQENS